MWSAYLIEYLERLCFHEHLLFWQYAAPGAMRGETDCPEIQPVADSV